MESKSVMKSSLFNHLILHHIFKYLPLSSLKDSRLVCKKWGYEAAKHVKVIVHVTPTNINDPKTNELLEFVKQYQMGHTLILTFLNPSLRDSNPLDTILEEFFEICEQEINYEVSLQMLNTISETNHLVLDLRLEIMLRSKQEGELFSRILKEMTGLRRFALEVVNWKEEGLLTIGDEGPSSVTKLGLRFNGYPDSDWGEIVNSQAYLKTAELVNNFISKLLNMFRNLEFLDTNGWERNHHGKFCSIYQTSCLKHICDMRSSNPTAFPNFKGLRHLVGYPEPETFQQIMSFKNLKHLHFQVDQYGLYQTGCISLSPQIVKLLSTHSQSLETFDFKWRLICTERGHNISLPILPKLKYLDVTAIASKIYEIGISRIYEDPWTTELVDILNLRELLLVSDKSFSKILPSLEHLGVLLPHANELESWEYIFPTGDETLKIDQVPQIRSLSISLISECSSSFISRLYAIFPNLEKFKHLRPEVIDNEKVFLVCEHKSIPNATKDEKNCGFGTENHINLAEYGFMEHLKQRNPGHCFWHDI